MADGRQTSGSLTATSSGGAVAFGFAATNLRIINTGASADVFVNVTTTSGCTTGDWPISTGSSGILSISSPDARKGYTGFSYVSSGSAAPPFRYLAIR